MEKAWCPIGEGRTLVTLQFLTRELRGQNATPPPPQGGKTGNEVRNEGTGETT